MLIYSISYRNLPDMYIGVFLPNSVHELRILILSWMLRGEIFFPKSNTSINIQHYFGLLNSYTCIYWYRLLITQRFRPDASVLITTKGAQEGNLYLFTDQTMHRCFLPIDEPSHLHISFTTYVLSFAVVDLGCNFFCLYVTFLFSNSYF